MSGVVPEFIVKFVVKEDAKVTVADSRGMSDRLFERLDAEPIAGVYGKVRDLLTII